MSIPLVLSGHLGQFLSLKLLGGPDHHVDPRRKAQQCKQHHQPGPRSKKRIKPVSDAESDPETGYQFNHHAPRMLRLAVVFLLVRLVLFDPLGPAIRASSSFSRCFGSLSDTSSPPSEPC